MTSSPRTLVMDMLRGAWVCQVVATLARLNIPDLLQRHGPLTARELTGAHGVAARPDLLQRVLRASASVGLLSEDAAGRFGPTPLSEVLTAAAPGSLKGFADLIGGPWWATWGTLPETLQTGARPRPSEPRREVWDYKDPERMKRFAAAMKSMGPALEAAIARCDLSARHRLVDLGGGVGHMAVGYLQRYAQLEAVVLELAELVPVAREIASQEVPELSERLAFEAGDMFADVPAGDAYLLSRIIHDWDDEHCVRVLRNCHARLVGDGRIFCVDAILPPLGDTSGMPVKLMDLLMMLTLPGRERTEAEWRALFDQAGLRLISTTRLDDAGMSLIEATPDRV